MIAMAVDDEGVMLKRLVEAVSASPDIDSVASFSACSAALEWARENPVDLAFLDIEMRGMGGMALAEQLSVLRPACRIIFCTGFPQYALDAFRIHVSGYLMKPITAGRVQQEIDHIKGGRSQEKLLTVHCFGSFEVYSHGLPLGFRRTKSKEVLAFLVDRNGAGVTAKEICAQLWEDNTNDAKNMNYFYQLYDGLRHTLKTSGAESVLVRSGKSYAVDTDRLDCDYFRYLKTGHPTFYGEYMVQYSWAEETCALLQR